MDIVDLVAEDIFLTHIQMEEVLMDIVPDIQEEVVHGVLEEEEVDGVLEEEAEEEEEVVDGHGNFIQLLWKYIAST